MEYPTSYPTSSPDETNFEVIERSIALFVILGIICGNITEYMFENVSFPIPYHVVVFFEGVIISVLLKYVILESTTFENVICEPSVSSDLIIYVFLPALLFKETMNLNWHHVTSGFSQYMLLAGPGCLFGGLVTGVLSYYILWHLNWSWQVCFLFGSILSTTDPVSIIAVLNSTGASHKLSTVIVGESLFNDGSAMLMYFFFYQEQTYTSNASLLVAFIFKMVFGSPVMGITFGLITHKLMRFFDTPDESKIDIQIAITLACAYISFYVAEGPCEVSGVLSCCSAGLVISWLGSPKILDNDKMHSIWENLEWFCNTLIFFIAGLIAGSKALSASEGSIGKDFASLFIMYIVVTIVRYVMILLAYPVLKDIGFKLTFNEAMFIGFSGLRGALGISLSLIVQSNFSNAPNFFFLYAGIAALTLLINGSLATLMIRFLRLVEDPDAPKSPEMNLVLRQIKRSIRLKVHKELENMKSELGDYNADEVNKLCRVLRGSRDLGNVIVSPAEDLKSMINRISIDSSIYHSTLGDMKDDENQTQRPRVSIDLLAFVRATFLDTLKARYWDCIRSGKLGTHAYSAKLLLYSVDVAQDHVNNPNIGFADWDCIENGLKVNGIYLAFCRFLDDVCEYFSYYPGFVSYAEAKRERMAIYTLLNFIDAHTFAQSKIHEFLGGGQDDDISIIEESMARKHSTTEIEKAKALLALIPKEDVKAFYTSRAARIVILKQMETVDHMLSLGALSQKSAKLIYESIDDDNVQLTKERDTIHRSFLKTATNRKREEDIELRKSIRASNIGLAPDDTFRPTLSMRGSQFRNSVRKSMNTGNGSKNDPSSLVSDADDTEISSEGAPSFSNPNDVSTVINPMSETDKEDL